MPVVATFKLNNFVAPGITAGQANRAHGGLGARVDHTNHFHTWNNGANLVGQLNFQLGGGAKGHGFF